MEEKIIQLCRDVIQKNGDISKCDCVNINCNYCPFSMFNLNDEHPCTERKNKYNYNIAHEYISCNCMEKNQIDNVNSPTHYNVGKIEVIEAIEDWKLNFNLGNAIKYIARCEHKENKKQDLEKAKWYIEREISKCK